MGGEGCEWASPYQKNKRGAFVLGLMWLEFRACIVSWGGFASLGKTIPLFRLGWSEMSKQNGQVVWVILKFALAVCRCPVDYVSVFHFSFSVFLFWETLGKTCLELCPCLEFNRVCMCVRTRACKHVCMCMQPEEVCTLFFKNRLFKYLKYGI